MGDNATPTQTEERVALISEHLQFLGYSTEPMGRAVILATHPTRPKVFLRVMEHFITITLAYRVHDINAEASAELLGLVNELNANAMLPRYSLREKGSLWCDGTFWGPYERQNFGAFFQDWIDEVILDLDENEEALDKFLM